MHIYLSLLFVFVASFLGGQTVKQSITIPWKEAEKPVQQALYFSGAYYQKEKTGNLPHYFRRFGLKSDNPIRVSIQNEEYLPLNDVQLSALEKESVPAAVKPEFAVAIEKKNPFVNVTLLPFRSNPNTGQVEKLVSFDLVITQSLERTTSQKKGRKYASNSVLASGNWYKIAVVNEGLHHITYGFLQDLGMNPANINPQNLKIYGHEGGMLPEPNAAPRHDDLYEMAIIVNGENDGRFDPNDEVIFFGQSPHTWNLNESTQTFQHQFNHYSDTTYYFITAGSGKGKRVKSENPSGTSNITVTAFDDYAFYEKDLSNPLHSGRVWLGERFDVKTSQDFTFSFSNIVSGSNARLRSSVAASSTTSSSSFSISLNGSGLTSHTLSKADGGYAEVQGYISTKTSSFTATLSTFNINVSYNKPSTSAKAWLNFLEINVRRNLVFSNGQLLFRDKNSIGTGNNAEFRISNSTSAIKVWEVTNPLDPVMINGNYSNGIYSFNINTDSLRTFLAYNGSSYHSPIAKGAVSNQNLHGLSQQEMIILTPAEFISEANRLADFHRSNGKKVAVVKTGQVFNEFSSGAQDVTAIRDFIKMFYDRATGTSDLPECLLLFGDGSYDYKTPNQDNTNYVPTYQSKDASYDGTDKINPAVSFATDDYFAFLDDSEGSGITGSDHSLDIAVGRLPVKTLTEARGVVNKIIHYTDPSTFGNWRNYITFVADDEDGATHINDADKIARFTTDNHPAYNVEKLYLDAFEQQSLPGGSRYPQVNDAINARMYAGTFIMNFTGHGNTSSWTEERVLGVDDINSWENYDKLPLFITATCEFSRFDDPDKTSAGEQILLNPYGGGIGLVTTVRLVYSNSNYNLNRNFFEQVFETENGKRPSLGEVTRRAKNNSVTGANNRKFILLGDPALTLAYPEHKVRTTKVNSVDFATDVDTLKALSKVMIEGEVTDESGQILSGFNGTVYPSIFDKKDTLKTLKNDPGSNYYSFVTQKDIIYRGKASISNGRFKYSFIVPKDIAYAFGNGKISYYADNPLNDAHGMDEIIIGGTADSFAQDNTGPDIRIFLNNEKFAFGGTSDESPLLLIKLNDESGINTVGNGIGHDITAVLDDNTQNTYVLNQFYESEMDNYQAGEVRYPLSELEEGRHTITAKAWDVHNNSGESFLEFIVTSDEELALEHVLNYPNPFTTNTSFLFEHNRPGDILEVRIDIFTIAGRLVKQIHRQITSDGYRVGRDEITWDGLDEFNDPIGRGVYVYKLTVFTSDGKKAEKFQKLVILK